MDGFIKIVGNQNIIVDIKWKKAFYQYTELESSKYGKKLVIAQAE